MQPNLPLSDSSSLALRLEQVMAQLPFISADLPGVGGVIKAQPADFQVEEILPYRPCGEGEHLFITLRRSGWNTLDVAQALGDHFGLKRHDMGWGGRKDKNAIVTQTFSLRLPMTMSLDVVRTELGRFPFDVIDVQRHRNKLKTGHVAGNRFQILLSNVGAAALARAHAIATALQKRGLPNFYGEQRFGIQMRNLYRAAELLDRRRPVRGPKQTFLVSALQSALFNVWLAARMQRHQFGCIISGDVAQKTDTGGLFTVADTTEANARFANSAIIYTGPLFGYKMMPAADQAGEYENAVLTSVGLNRQVFKPLRAPGSRRAAVLRIADLTIDRAAKGLRFTFSLPSGAYATTVMREFMRPPQV